MTSVHVHPAGPFDMSGQVAWVTGSASGIGTAVARLLAQCGADLVLHGLNQREVCASLKTEFEALGSKVMIVDGDLTSAAAIAGMVDEIRAGIGGISILINCAGGSPRKSTIADMDDADWDHVIRLNLKTVFLTTKAALPLLQEAAKAGQSPAIVNVTSCVTRTGGVPNGACYATAKGGVEVFTRALAKEVAPDGIRVNAVAPGLVDSPFHERDAKVAYAHRLGSIPLGRIGAPEDVAGPIVFFASGAARYVTGEIMEVSGGTRLV